MEGQICTIILGSGKRKGESCNRINCQYHGEKRFIEVITLVKNVYVRNVEGSSTDKKNWKKYWIKHTKDEYPETCRAKDCVKKATATGHMYLRDVDNEKINYLIPICSHHNSCKYNAECFLLKKMVKAVKIKSRSDLIKEPTQSTQSANL